MTQFLDKAGLIYYTSKIKERLEQLQGLGKFLSIWDAQEGKPQTEPETIPYQFHTGDYFLVTNTVKAVPESVDIMQTTGTSLSDLAIDTSIYKAKVNPTTDKLDTFAYTDIQITNYFVGGSEGKTIIVLEDEDKFKTCYNRIKNEEVANMKDVFIAWFVAFGTLYYRVSVSEEGSSTKINSDIFTEQVSNVYDTMTDEDIKAYVVEKLTQWGLKVVGPVYVGKGVQDQFEWEFGFTVNEEIRWTYNNTTINDISEYGISFSGEPVLGDVITLQYTPDKVNYKPTGTEYDGTASTTIEELEVGDDDTYIFDGSVWHLLSNGQKEVSFGALAGEPSDNAKLKEVLDVKVDHYAELPTASSDNLGLIVQYVGQTTEELTRGYFYEVVLEEGVYVWKEIQTQESTAVIFKRIIDEEESGE